MANVRRFSKVQVRRWNVALSTAQQVQMNARVAPYHPRFPASEALLQICRYFSWNFPLYELTISKNAHPLNAYTLKRVLHCLLSPHSLDSIGSKQQIYFNLRGTITLVLYDRTWIRALADEVGRESVPALGWKVSVHFSFPRRFRLGLG